jgi:hypothetical protein
MEEIRQRSELIAHILTDGATLGREDFDYELIALNLRKILELIAFASIMGNLDAYRRAYADAEKHWNAKRILLAVQKINPNFYPVPVEMGEPDANGVKHFKEPTKEFLNRSEFEQLYDLCGSVLHVPNNIAGKKKVINFVRHPGLWLMRIHNLLNTHYIKLAHCEDVWLVVMDDPADGKVHTYACEATTTAG